MLYKCPSKGSKPEWQQRRYSWGPRTQRTSQHISKNPQPEGLLWQFHGNMMMQQWIWNILGYLDHLRGLGVADWATASLRFLGPARSRSAPCELIPQRIAPIWLSLWACDLRRAFLPCPRFRQRLLDCFEIRSGQKKRRGCSHCPILFLGRPWFSFCLCTCVCHKYVI